MLKISLTLFSLVATTLSVSGFADIRGGRTLGFVRPANTNELLLPTAVEGAGLPAPSCADIDYYAEHSAPRYSGEVFLTGSGSWVCWRGIGEMYGNPRLTPPTQGSYGSVSTELFDELVAACLQTVTNGGCTESVSVSVPDTGSFTSLSGPPDAEPIVAPIVVPIVAPAPTPAPTPAPVVAPMPSPMPSAPVVAPTPAPVSPSPTGAAFQSIGTGAAGGISVGPFAPSAPPLGTGGSG